MNARPVVLFTDFGIRDFYAGVMRAVIAAASPASRVVDLQHDIPAHDIASASFVLARSWEYLPPDAVVLVVVDPGVGSERRGLVVRLGDRVLVGPDNGFASDLLLAAGAADTGAEKPDFFMIEPGLARREIGVEPRGATFHGRDIFAPVAAAIARGAAPSAFGDPIEGIVMLRGVPSVSIDSGRVHGAARYVDHFGNLLTDIPVAVIRRVFGDRARVRVTADDRDLGPLRNTYAQGRPGELMALVNSWGLVEAAVNGGRAIDHFAGAPPTAIRFVIHAGS